jgi:plasmid stability protein
MQNASMDLEASMATLTIKNLPDELYESLKARAALARRSINSEAIVCLENVLLGKMLDEEQLAGELRTLRERSPLYLTESEVRRAIDEGRP